MGMTFSDFRFVLGGSLVQLWGRWIQKRRRKDEVWGLLLKSR